MSITTRLWSDVGMRWEILQFSEIVSVYFDEIQNVSNRKMFASHPKAVFRRSSSQWEEVQSFFVWQHDKKHSQPSFANPAKSHLVEY